MNVFFFVVSCVVCRNFPKLAGMTGTAATEVRGSQWRGAGINWTEAVTHENRSNSNGLMTH
jgi:hypothetical protein